MDGIKPADDAHAELRIPNHIAIIMDGNGRWAQSRGLPRSAGHKEGTENLRRILKECVRRGIKVLTIYAFSTENWNRPPAEVMTLMRLLEIFIERELNELNDEGVSIRHVGKEEGVAPHLLKKIQHACEMTKDNDTIIVNVAFNYGGRDEIVQAVRSIVQEGIPAGEITEEVINDHLFTHGQPDPDLIIRTSGELRISNFLIWQAAYAEYYATEAYWPDFDESELHKAIAEYSRRKRRFGKTDAQIAEEQGEK
ncbi:MAG: isoprenyl transferase [Chloroflexota bacterium]